ncbi:MAG: M28 family peptidase [Planctomycetota bacterium]|nr:M28 family peptidase [Planctomycetota bacterium]
MQIQPTLVALLVPCLFLSVLPASLSAQEAAQGSVRPGAVKPVPEQRRQGFESVDPELCKKWLSYLASDELRGRATGKPGYKKAAEFVAARFAEFGLKPVGADGSYFQDVPFFAVGADPEQSFIAVLSADGKELCRVALGKGLGGRISENSDKEFELVSLVAKSAEDIDKDQLGGKAVLFVDQSERGRRGTVASRALRTARPGAILTVDDRSAALVDERISSGNRGRNRVASSRFRSLNSYAISSAAAKKVRAAIAAQSGGVKLKTHVVVSRRPVFGANVLGLLEGSDPKLKHEVVGIGSHLDHIGANGDSINNGADDDGSGTTGVLAVARAFSKNPTKPRRSILFMCFSGEERGMIGSGYYANNPVFPNEEMIAELQMDMIGRNEEVVDRRSGEVTEKAEDNINSLHLIGSKKLSESLHNTCVAINNAHIGFDFEYDEEDVFYRSDHVKFAQKDIPVAFFFTGFHPQYHRPDDTVEKINFPKLARVAKLVYSVAFEIGDADQRPKRDRLWKDVPQRRRRGR